MCGMAPIPGCVESTNGIIGWLNANAGAITGIATAALAGLTWRYVVLTKRLADAAVDQANAALEQTRLMAKAQDAVRREREHSLSRHVRHLIGGVEQVPFPLM